jgi:hypothetical protein
VSKGGCFIAWQEFFLQELSHSPIPVNYSGLSFLSPTPEGIPILTVRGKLHFIRFSAVPQQSQMEILYVFKGKMYHLYNESMRKDYITDSNSQLVFFNFMLLPSISFLYGKFHRNNIWKIVDFPTNFSSSFWDSECSKLFVKTTFSLGKIISSNIYPQGEYHA